MLRCKAFVLFFLFFLIKILHLTAGPIVYTDKTAFLLAISSGSNATVTFNGLAPAGGTKNINNKTYSGITFSSPTALLAISPTRPTPKFYQWNSGDTAVGYYYGEPIKAILPSEQFAVGADIMINEYVAGGVAMNMTTIITLADDTTFKITSLTLPNPQKAFIGFTSDVAIKQITFATLDVSPGKYYMPLIDNVTISTVPEPSISQLMLLVGLSFLIFPRRIYRLKQATLCS